MLCNSPLTPHSDFVESIELSLMLNVLFLDITFNPNNAGLCDYLLVLGGGTLCPLPYLEAVEAELRPLNT